MPYTEIRGDDRKYLAVAYEEARTGYEEGGVPVGAAMVQDGKLIARGRNGLVQEGNPILHGETACLRNAGRGVDYPNVTLYTLLSPCAMCAGAILLFGIARVVVGENKNFAGEIDWLLERGVPVALANDPEMIEFFAQFTKARPDLWGEDISGYTAHEG